jgi:hypothetical protein
LELLNYLHTNQFKEFIVSGGGIDFMREALSSVYEIPKDIDDDDIRLHWISEV